jgi:hypothetical protein
LGVSLYNSRTGALVASAVTFQAVEDRQRSACSFDAIAHAPRRAWTRWRPWGFRRQPPFKLTGHSDDSRWQGPSSASPKQGTGKTAAFLLPTIDRILDTAGQRQDQGADCRADPRIGACKSTKRSRGLATTPKSPAWPSTVAALPTIFPERRKRLTEGADIIIATPGRFLVPPDARVCRPLRACTCLILDEADRMLDMGFLGDIMRIAEKCQQ